MLRNLLLRQLNAAFLNLFTDQFLTNIQDDLNGSGNVSYSCLTKGLSTRTKSKRKFVQSKFCSYNHAFPNSQNGWF